MRIVQTIMLLLFVVAAGCATDSTHERMMAALQQRQRSRMEYIARMKASIDKLPYEQRQAEREKLIKEIDGWIAEDRRQDAIDAQSNLTDAVNDLTSELRQSRGGY